MLISTNQYLILLTKRQNYDKLLYSQDEKDFEIKQAIYRNLFANKKKPTVTSREENRMTEKTVPKKRAAKKPAAKTTAAPARKVLTVLQATKALKTAEANLKTASDHLGDQNDAVQSANEAVVNAEKLSEQMNNDFGQSTDKDDVQMVKAAAGKVKTAKSNLTTAEKSKNAALDAERDAENKVDLAVADLKVAKRSAPEKKTVKMTVPPAQNPPSATPGPQGPPGPKGPRGPKAKGNFIVALIALAALVLAIVSLNNGNVTDNRVDGLDSLAQAHTDAIVSVQDDVLANADAIIELQKADNALRSEDARLENGRWTAQKGVNRIVQFLGHEFFGMDPTDAWGFSDTMAVNPTEGKWSKASAEAPNHVSTRISSNTASIDSMYKDFKAHQVEYEAKVTSIMDKYTTPAPASTTNK